MRLTTKGRFAVTAMIDIALHGRSGPVTLASISLRQRVSLSYLELLFGKLRRADLVESTRGPGGGYSLSRKAADISVADIVLSIEEHDTDARRRDAGGRGRHRPLPDRRPVGHREPACGRVPEIDHAAKPGRRAEGQGRAGRHASGAAPRGARCAGTQAVHRRRAELGVRTGTAPPARRELN
jgi:Rrf2 family protein